MRYALIAAILALSACTDGAHASPTSPTDERTIVEFFVSDNYVLTLFHDYTWTTADAGEVVRVRVIQAGEVPLYRTVAQGEFAEQGEALCVDEACSVVRDGQTLHDPEGVFGVGGRDWRQFGPGT